MIKQALLLILSLSLVNTSVFAESTVRLMANTSPPYTDAKLPEEGLAMELVKHIYSRTSYSPEITIKAWSRAVEGAQIGVYDGLASVWYTEARNKDLMFSEPYLSSGLIMIKLRARPGGLRSLNDLSGRRLGIRSDYAYGIDFEAIPNVTLVEENHLIQNLLNLINGAVDVVIGDQRTMVMQINEYLGDQRSKFEVIKIDLPTRERHVAASREMAGHKEMIAAFNQSLAESRKDGSYEAIINKWDERYGGIK
ncbi:MAG: polar amino acid transport system substrate-binding protein [Halieaceae bacterium]|jgi:polar amino acid transport system substrate-binding protein